MLFKCRNQGEILHCAHERSRSRNHCSEAQRSLKRPMACLLRSREAYQGLSCRHMQGGNHHGVQLSKLVLSRGICTTLIFLLSARRYSTSYLPSSRQDSADSSCKLAVRTRRSTSLKTDQKELISTRLLASRLITRPTRLVYPSSQAAAAQYSVW